MINLKTLNFIKNIIFHTLQVRVVYSTPPYNNIEEHDIGLNNSLNRSEDLYRQMKETLASLEHHCFYFITSRFLMHYIVFLPFEDTQDVISVGPYLKESVTNKFIQELMSVNHMNFSDTDTLKSFFYSLPVLTENIQITTVLTDILNYITPMAPPFRFEEIDFRNYAIAKTDYTPREDFSAYAEAVERRYNIEAQLLNQIAKGNCTEAIRYSQEFLSHSYLPYIADSKENFYEHQMALLSANSLFRKAIEENEIHPVYLHDISNKYLHLISKTSSVPELTKMMEKMVREYCLLVNNYSMKQYSSNIRHILNYIQFHLDSSLTLSEIADQCGMSVSYLSAIFKKEMGISVITYINQKRVHMALQLLNTTDYSIQEISSHVGILDNNYFTKIFKKEIGCTPSEYRKKINQ